MQPLTISFGMNFPFLIAVTCGMASRRRQWPAIFPRYVSEAGELARRSTALPLLGLCHAPLEDCPTHLSRLCLKQVHKMSDRLFVGLSGLATDIQTLEQLLRFRLNLYKLREERDIKPETFSALLSHILYEKRFGPYFVEPLVAGLRAEDNTPFISGMDLIGAPVFAKDFVVAGTCAANLYGLCESFFKPDLEPEQLFEVLSQSLLASVDRDALSGWGAVVHVM